MNRWEEEQEWYKKGIEQGAEEERQRSETEKRASAKKFRDSGVDIEIIAEATGLSREEIAAL